MDYYQEKQFIAQVDKKDKVIGRIEKWPAHKKGVLHRGFTVIMIYDNQFILQQRKHPVFDGVYDFSFSSHQIYINNVLQDDFAAIYDSLKREWNIEKDDLKTKPKFLKKIYYRAKDPESDYAEHEVDYVYEIELKKLPNPNYDFCYGLSLIPRVVFLKSKVLDLKSKIAPWVKKIIEEKLI